MYTQTRAQTGVGVRVRLGAAIKRLLFTHFFHVVVTLDSTPPPPPPFPSTAIDTLLYPPRLDPSIISFLARSPSK